MSDERLEHLIDLSFKLEMNAAALYQLFSEAHPEDGDFWWELHLEEINHAHILREAKGVFLRGGSFPSELICPSIDALQKDNEMVAGLIEQSKDTPLSRQEAFKAAVNLENCAGESHYDLFMKQSPQSPISSVLHQLNHADKAHAARIEKRMNELFPNES